MPRDHTALRGFRQTFSYPDCTVGPGVSPDHASTLAWL